MVFCSGLGARANPSRHKCTIVYRYGSLNTPLEKPAQIPTPPKPFAGKYLHPAIQLPYPSWEAVTPLPFLVRRGYRVGQGRNGVRSAYGASELESRNGDILCASECMDMGRSVSGSFALDSSARALTPFGVKARQYYTARYSTSPDVGISDKQISRSACLDIEGSGDFG